MIRKLWYKFRRRLKRHKTVTYRWPKPLWQRLLRLPVDIVLLHLHLLRSAFFFLHRTLRKKNSCLFCASRKNADRMVKYCFPATRYGNLGIARLICPCVGPPESGFSKVPCCRINRKSSAIFVRLFSTTLLLGLLWTSTGFALYLYPPSRRLVARVVKPDRLSARADIAKQRQDPEKAGKLLAEARSIAEKKEWGNARIILLNAQAYDEKNVEILYELVGVLLELKRYPAALAKLEQCVKLTPDNLLYLQEFSWLTAAVRKPELLDPYLDTAPASTKQRPAYKLLNATALLRREKRTEALAQLQSIMADPAVQPDDLMQAGWLLLEHFHDPETALPFAERAVKQQPDNPAAILLMAQTLRGNGHFDRAQSWLGRLEQQGFNSPAFQIEHIEHAVHAGDLDEAIDRLEVLTSRNPGFSYARARLAELYLASRRIDEAWSVAEELTRARRPVAYAQGQMVLAKVAIQSRFFSEAIAHAEKARQTLGSNYAVHVLLARAHFNAGQHETARTHLDAALQLKPGRLDSLLTRAAIDFAMGNDTNGLRTLRDIAGQDNLDAPVLLQLSSLAAREGEFGIARAACEELLRREPQSPLALQRLVAVLVQETSTLPLAQKFAMQLKESYPGSEAAAALFGQVLLKLGRDEVEQQFPVFRKHTDAFPLSASLAAQRGRAHFLVGQREEARTHLERALTIDPEVPDAREWLEEADRAGPLGNP